MIILRYFSLPLYADLACNVIPGELEGKALQKWVTSAMPSFPTEVTQATLQVGYVQFFICEDGGIPIYLHRSYQLKHSIFDLDASKLL